MLSGDARTLAQRRRRGANTLYCNANISDNVLRGAVLLRLTGELELFCQRRIYK